MSRLAVIFVCVLLLAESRVIWGIPLNSQPEVVFGTDFLRLQDDSPTGRTPYETLPDRVRTSADSPLITQREALLPANGQTRTPIQDPQQRPRNIRLSSRHLGKLDPNDQTPDPTQDHIVPQNQGSFSRRTPQELATVNKDKPSGGKFITSRGNVRRINTNQEQSNSHLPTTSLDTLPLVIHDYDYYNYYMDDVYNFEGNTTDNATSDIKKHDTNDTTLESEAESRSSIIFTTTTTSTPISLTEPTTPTPTSIPTTTKVPTTTKPTSRHRSTTKTPEQINLTTTEASSQKLSKYHMSSINIQNQSLPQSRRVLNVKTRTEIGGPSRSQIPLALIRGRKAFTATTKSLPENVDASKTMPSLPADTIISQGLTTKLPAVTTSLPVTTESQTTTTPIPLKNQTEITLPTGNKSIENISSNTQHSQDNVHHNTQSQALPVKSPNPTTLVKIQSPETEISSNRNKAQNNPKPSRNNGVRSFRYTTPSSKPRMTGRGTDNENSLKKVLGSTSSSSSIVVKVSVEVPTNPAHDSSDPPTPVSPVSATESSPVSSSVVTDTTTSIPQSSLTTETNHIPTLNKTLSSPSSESNSRMILPLIKSFSNQNIIRGKSVSSEQTNVTHTDNQSTSKTIQAEEYQQTTSYLLSDPLIVDLESEASSPTTTRSERKHRPDPLLLSPSRRTKSTVVGSTTTSVPVLVVPSKPFYTTTTSPPTITNTPITSSSTTTNTPTTSPPTTTTTSTTSRPTTTNIPTTSPPTTTNIPTTSPPTTTTTPSPTQSSTTSTESTGETTTHVPSTVATTKSDTITTTPNPITSDTNNTTKLDTGNENESLTVEGLSQGVVENIQVRRGHSRALDFQTSVVEVMGTVAADSPTNSTPASMESNHGNSSASNVTKQEVQVDHPKGSSQTSSNTTQQSAVPITRNKLPPEGSPEAQQGLAPHGLSPFGQAPQGLSPFGIAPTGVVPQGLIPEGLHPHGLAPQGAISQSGEKGKSEDKGSSAGLTLVDANVGAEGADANSTVGYVVEEHNLSRFRLEEKTPDGFIIGEYGIVDHTTGDVNGVRYTADGTADPQLIYESLMRFLKL